MPQVFQPYARFSAPVDEIDDFIQIDDITLPDGIKSLSTAKVNGGLKVQSTPDEDLQSRYTPTATIKAGLTDKTIVVEEDGTVTHQTVSAYEKDLGWNAMEEAEINTIEVTYAEFFGRGDKIIVHDLLRAEMFKVLCELTHVATQGHAEGILFENNELQPIWCGSGGEFCDAELTLEKTTPSSTANSSPSNESSVNWSKQV